MRLAYASLFDAAEFSSASRSGHLVPRALAAAGHEVIYLGPVHVRRSLMARAIGKAWRTIDPGLALPEREPAVLRAGARAIDAAIASLSAKGERPDALVAPGVLAVAHTTWPGPLAIWCDCTLGAMIDYFPGFTGLTRRARRHAMDAENRALRRADIAAFPSAWAAESAIRDHGCDPSRVHVIPFGGSFPEPPLPLDTIFAARAAHRATNPRRVLWIGMEWPRKRGDLAIDTAIAVRRAGLEVELVMVGSTPPPDSAHAQAVPSFVRLEGVIDVGTPAGQAHLRELYCTSDVLLLPTLADCAPIVMRDAMAHALPIIATQTGGLPTMVAQGVEGYLLPLDADANEYARLIAELVSSPERHLAMAQAARKRYDTELSWTIGTCRLAELLARVQR